MNLLQRLASLVDGRPSPRPAPAPGRAPSSKPRGLVAAGNIDLGSRPQVRNADGSVSTVRSISVGTDRGEVLIPTVSADGRVLSNDDAIALYRRTGRHLGIFRSPADATSFAKRLHAQQSTLVPEKMPAPLTRRAAKANSGAK